MKLKELKFSSNQLPRREKCGNRRQVFYGQRVKTRNTQNGSVDLRPHGELIYRRSAPEEDTLQLTFEIENGLAEVVNAPGSMAAIENAVHRVILNLKDNYWEKLSRAPSASSFRGTEKI